MSVVDKAREAAGGVEKFFSKLPGVKGYKDKELRREADKRLRKSLARSISTQRRRLSALQLDLLKSGGLELMDDLDRAVGKAQLLKDRVSSASYGYAPFFDLERIKEDELDRLIQFDQEIAERLPGLASAVDRVADAVAASEGVEDALAGVMEVLVELNELFGQRSDSIRGLAGEF